MRNTITALAIVATSVATADAATRCIPMNDTGQIQCDAILVPTEKYPDSESVCSVGNASIHAHVMGVCSAELAPKGTVADSVNISTETKGTMQCWCRLIRPAVSKWVALKETTVCDCGRQCTLDGTGDFEFRYPLFHTFI